MSKPFGLSMYCGLPELSGYKNCFGLTHRCGRDDTNMVEMAVEEPFYGMIGASDDCAYSVVALGVFCSSFWFVSPPSASSLIALLRFGQAS